MGMATHPELDGVEVYLVKISPEHAAEMLTHNTKGQRTISKAAVERYATDMVSMEWIFNGAPILFSDSNELLDGQHRLNAIVESGEPQVVLVVRGVNAAAMVTIDTGRKRSYADSLKIRGYKNHSTVAALAAANWYWQHGNYGVRQVGRIANPQFLSATPSNAQKDFWMDKVQKTLEVDFQAASTFAIRAYGKRRGISTATYSLAWVILGGIDKYVRDEFFHELLVESKSPKSGYPIVALCNRLGRLRPNEEFSRVDQLDALFTTYNFWIAGKDLTTLTPPRPVRWDTLEIPTGYRELADIEAEKAN